MTEKIQRKKNVFLLTLTTIFLGLMPLTAKAAVTANCGSIPSTDACLTIEHPGLGCSGVQFTEFFGVFGPGFSSTSPCSGGDPDKTAVTVEKGFYADTDIFFDVSLGGAHPSDLNSIYAAGIDCTGDECEITGIVSTTANCGVLFNHIACLTIEHPNIVPDLFHFMDISTSLIFTEIIGPFFSGDPDANSTVVPREIISNSQILITGGFSFSVSPGELNSNYSSGVDCTGAECTITDIVSTFTVDTGGLATLGEIAVGDIRDVELRKNPSDDAVFEFQHYPGFNGSTRFSATIFKNIGGSGLYYMVAQQNGLGLQDKIFPTDCNGVDDGVTDSNDRCILKDFLAVFTLNAPGQIFSGFLNKDDGNPGTAFGAEYLECEGPLLNVGFCSFPVFKDIYDLDLNYLFEPADENGAAIVDAIDCASPDDGKTNCQDVCVVNCDAVFDPIEFEVITTCVLEARPVGCGPDICDPADAGCLLFCADISSLWHLDEAGGADALDASAFGNDGLISAGVTYDSGKVGASGLLLPELDNVSVADSPTLQIIGDITIAAWVKTTDSNGGTIMSKSSAAAGVGTLSLLASGQVVFSRGDGIVSEDSATSSSSINDGQWHHVMGTSDGSNLRLYIDGVEEASTPITIAATDTGESYILGSGLTGSLDEVAIFQKALSSEEASELYNRSGPSGLAHRYQLEGDTTDSVSGQDGTFTGSFGFSATSKEGASALDFDNVSGRLEIDQSDILVGMDTSDTFSVALWLRARDITNFHEVFGKALDNLTGVHLRVDTAGNLQFLFYNASNGGYLRVDASGLTSDAYHHVVVTNDGSVDNSGMNIYVDGLHASSPAVNNKPIGSVANAEKLLLGARRRPGPSFDLFLNGLLDDITIYGTELSSSDVVSLYQRAVTTPVIHDYCSSADEAASGLSYDAGGVAIHPGVGDVTDDGGGSSTLTVDGFNLANGNTPQSVSLTIDDDPVAQGSLANSTVTILDTGSDVGTEFAGANTGNAILTNVIKLRPSGTTGISPEAELCFTFESGTACADGGGDGFDDYYIIGRDGDNPPDGLIDSENEPPDEIIPIENAKCDSTTIPGTVTICASISGFSDVVAGALVAAITGNADVDAACEVSMSLDGSTLTYTDPDTGKSNKRAYMKCVTHAVFAGVKAGTISHGGTTDGAGIGGVEPLPNDTGKIISTAAKSGVNK